MKISLSMPLEMMVRSNGHGEVGYQMVTALQRLGHTVPYQDASAPVEINYCHPQDWQWSNPDNYHIGFLAWESTMPKPGWKRIINDGPVDEIFTPSPLITRWVQKWTDKKVSTYLHGIDSSTWSAKKRVVENQLRFLHPDSSANRKNAEMTVEAFKEAFGESTDYQLTLKHVGQSLVRKTGGNVKSLPGTLNENELVRVYKYHHVMVLPSSGEGFGLPTLNSIVTGMPTIIPGVWAPYRKYVLPQLDLQAKLQNSPWPVEHPGRVFEVDYDDLVAKFKYVATNFSRLSSISYANSSQAAEEFSWDNVTRLGWRDIFTRFGD